MTTRFPATGIDDATTLPNPTASSTTNSPSHSAQHANVNDAVKAVETKVGTGASTPVVNTLLMGTGTGTSAWSALTSAQLAASISDETGSGKAVFGTSPTLITPAIDTINESTPGNGVTVGGMNIKAGVPTLPTGVITAANIATSAITLGYAQITALYSNASNTPTQVPGLTVTVTVPSGGRRVKITAFCGNLYNSSGASGLNMSIWDGTVNTGTRLQASHVDPYVTGAGYSVTCVAVITPVAGSKTYNVGLHSDNGAAIGNVSATATNPAFILVEAI